MLGEIIFVVLVYFDEHCEDIYNLFPMTLKDFKVKVKIEVMRCLGASQKAI